MPDSLKLSLPANSKFSLLGFLGINQNLQSVRPFLTLFNTDDKTSIPPCTYIGYFWGAGVEDTRMAKYKFFLCSTFLFQNYLILIPPPISFTFLIIPSKGSLALNVDKWLVGRFWLTRVEQIWNCSESCLTFYWWHFLLMAWTQISLQIYSTISLVCIC